MRYDKLTLKAQEALQEADSLAHSFSHTALEPEHLLLALVEQKDGVIPIRVTLMLFFSISILIAFERVSTADFEAQYTLPFS